MSGTRRPWLAAALAFISPGLGHVYLREWLRAMLWFGIGLTTAVLVIGPDGIDTASVGAFLHSVAAVSFGASLAISAVTLLSMVDAYLLAERDRQRAAASAATAANDAGNCPFCGKELEEGLDFCHWCTEPLPSRGSATAESP